MRERCITKLIIASHRFRETEYSVSRRACAISLQAYMAIAADEARNTPSSSLHAKLWIQRLSWLSKNKVRVISWDAVDLARSKGAPNTAAG